MATESKRLSNPSSTGGAGPHFEAHIQASFVVLMLTGGYAPCLPSWPISEINLQGKIDGYETDDLIVCVEHNLTREKRKLLCQVKRSVDFTRGSPALGEVIHAAWNDFINPTVFTQNTDIIALVTGPIKEVDQINVQWLMHQAKHTKDSVEFFRHVEQANFSPDKAGEKLDIFRHHLRNANADCEVSDEEVYRFFNHFHILGYDVGGETGVVLPLLHSHISQFQQTDPKMIWGRIVDVVQTWNQNAGTITREKLPKDLLEMFRRRSIPGEIPEDLMPTYDVAKTDWAKHDCGAALALLSLLGAWNEKNEHDIEVISEVLGLSYEEWLPKAREILHHSDSPLKLKNGIWTVTRKESLLIELGSQIFDLNIDSFKTIAISVLSESDSSFDLSDDQRYTASMYGSKLKYSDVLRQGVAEGIALLGSQPRHFVNCTSSHAVDAALLMVRKLLQGAQWQQWATLNVLLPELAEAAPKEFIEQVNTALSANPCPFDDVFAQEDTGIAGGNYITGLLWALEVLAWEERYLIQVCNALAELAVRDPGGNWANRPANSITTILLPWLPQTLAVVDKRNVAVKMIVGEKPDIGWALLLQLLPGQHQTSSGTHKPKWRKTLPEDPENSVPQKEYWTQINFCSELAVDAASGNCRRISKLINYMDHLPETALEKFITVLSSEEIKALGDEDRRIIWDRLVKFTTRHRKFSAAKWAMRGKDLVRIERLAKSLTPTDPFILNQHLFSDNESDHYEEIDSLEEQEEKLIERRKVAIEELLAEQGLDKVIELAGVVASPSYVGHALGATSPSLIDNVLLPNYLIVEDRNLKEFIKAYLWERRSRGGWEWADRLPKEDWSKEQFGQFLAHLPFEKNAWDRVITWLNSAEAQYWNLTPAMANQSSEDLPHAIEKLIQYGRPRAAVGCLWKMKLNKEPIDENMCIRALLAGVASGESPCNNMYEYYARGLIKYLQMNNSDNNDELWRVELAYLSLLDGSQDVTPIILENKLTTDPDFFCKFMQIIYRSKKNDQEQQDISEKQKTLASNVWQLLDHWKTPPGVVTNGGFNPDQFDTWITRVKEICIESGHFEVAMSNIGDVLINAPADTDGLWIHRTIAGALNSEDAGDMRHGYRVAAFNARGPHWVDPTGRQEKELADKFLQRAETVENEGYHRLAQCLRDIADKYT